MRVWHHVQLSCPPGGEDLARSFWGAALGFVEVPKPAQLAGRGGCWFRAFDGDRIAAEVHVGVEQPFVPAAKAHPALMVDGPSFEAMAARVAAGGFAINHAERESFPGHLRFHCLDGHGNRVEVLTPIPHPR